ncbi:MAG TPA: penicillin-binding protein 2 [Alphaproteobacteria bacterium]|nr:penicillin-binding protein 2 [Alphaproteobacteria bacterium]
MYRDQDRLRIFTRRAILLAGGKLALVSALIGRMYYLQVLESARYRTLADDNRINLRLLAPPRGRIVDRYGALLAYNRQQYRVSIIAEQTPSVDATLDRLSVLLPITDYERRRVERDVKRKRRFVPITVRENLEWEDVAKIELHIPDLPGVVIDTGQTRFYPLEDLGSHLVGYVAAVSEQELQGSDDPLLELPDFRIGKSGVERAADLRMRGRAGTTEVEVNALGRVVRVLSRTEGVAGEEAELSIDSELQQFAYKRFGEQVGGAAVVDCENGEVLMLVSTPGYDPNAFNKGLSGPEWRALLNNEYNPLTNKAIAGQYSPGSTFKTMVALAALEAGAITADHRVTCIGHTELGNVRFHCWKKGGHGSLDLPQALMNSCDVYFYDTARRVGVDKIADMCTRFGLGSPTGIEIPGEKGGLVPTRAWKRAARRQAWTGGDTYVLGIGQGYILTTPLQLAVMTARIASGGRAIKPNVIRGYRAMPSGNGEEGPLVRPAALSTGEAEIAASLGVDPAYIAVVQKGMDMVVNVPGATAYRSRQKNPAYRMAGKTGTSQVKRITMAERARGVIKTEDRPWRDRDNALFIGYAPVDKPKYAVAVVVEHGGGGAAVAGPMARDIIEFALNRNANPPARVNQPTPRDDPHEDQI